MKKNLTKFWLRKSQPQQNPKDTPIEFSYKEFAEGDGTSLSENLNRVHILHRGVLSDKGKTLGLDNQPKSLTTIPYGLELETSAFYQKFINRTRKICWDNLFEKKTNYATAAEKVSEFEKRKVDYIKSETERLKRAREVYERKSEIGNHQLKETLKEKLTESNTTISNHKNEIREIEAVLSKDNESKPSGSRKILLLLILLAIGILEYPMNMRILFLMREDVISTILITALFSIIIPFAAHAFGSHLKKKVLSTKDLFWVVVAIFSAIGISWIIGDIRYDYLKEKDIEILSAYGYGFINIILFLIGSWASYHWGYKNPELIKQLISYKNELKLEEKNRDDFQSKLNSLEFKAADELQDISLKLPIDAKPKIDSELSELRSALTVKEKEYSALLTAVQSIEALICSYYIEAIRSFRSSNERWRNTPNPEYWANPIPPLQTYFLDEKSEGLDLMTPAFLPV